MQLNHIQALKKGGSSAFCYGTITSYKVGRKQDAKQTAIWVRRKKNRLMCFKCSSYVGVNGAEEHRQEENLLFTSCFLDL